jgi:hypothetical protein
MRIGYRTDVWITSETHDASNTCWYTSGKQTIGCKHQAG